MDLATSRTTLHRVAVHVLGRARHGATGRFGLRAAPGGFATPAFGDGPEVLRVAGGVLVRETAAGAAFLAIHGVSLGALADFAGVSLGGTFSAGADTPDLGDVRAPLVLDLAVSRLLARWLALGQRLLDHVCAGLPAAAAPGVVQLWPEHFDLATHIALPGGDHANLGASLGDASSDDPYLYVGPWSDARPGGPGYWNAPFGAVRSRSELTGAGASGDGGARGEGVGFDAGLRFYTAGLARLGVGRTGRNR